jgi:hypothetical protein
MIDLVTAQKIVAHYQRVQGLTDWSFAVSIVPGLKFDGGDAWAVVAPNVAKKHADVQIRDTDKTPIPGFDGDPVLELKLTVSHELWHCWTAPIFGGTDNEVAIAYEEKFVEAAARAVVLSEGTNDARIMARSVQAIPVRIRARAANSSALATRQRIAGRKQSMDPKMIEEIIAAIKEGNGEAAIELLTKLLASAAGGVVGGDGAAREDAVAKPKEEGIDMVAARDTETPFAARARISINGSIAKADRSARVSAEIATRARIKELRADGITIDEASAVSLVKLGDIDAAEERIGWMLKGRETTTTRARSGVLSEGSNDATHGHSVDSLTKAGHSAEMAGHVIAEFKRGKEFGDTALDSAMKFRKVAP